MIRALFEKTGNGVWISHLDLMRLFQRAFKRAGLPLTHTQGYNPRPSVSIALPLSVGVESRCELLDFELEGERVPMDQIRDRLNAALVEGVRVLDVYEDGRKLKELRCLHCQVRLCYDREVPAGAADQIRALFGREELLVEKKGKNGIQEQNIIPMIVKLEVGQEEGQICLDAMVCCQEPSLNPMQLSAAVERYLPDLIPDAVSCCRIGLYDQEHKVFK